MTRNSKIIIRKLKGGWSVIADGKTVLSGVSKERALEEMTLQKRRLGIKERK